MDIEDFVAVSGRWEVFQPRPGRRWERALEAFLSDLAEALQRSGCSMIGHLKGMLGDAGGPSLFFSLTSFNGSPQLRGASPDGDEAQVLSLNVIAAGIGGEEARLVLEEAVHGHFHTPSM